MWQWPVLWVVHAVVAYSATVQVTVWIPVGETITQLLASTTKEVYLPALTTVEADVGGLETSGLGRKHYLVPEAVDLLLEQLGCLWAAGQIV